MGKDISLNESERQEIGNRLKEFVQKNFESIDAFARNIAMDASNLRTHYFKGKSLPGSELLLKLKNFGCDIDWLLTGKKKTHYEPHPEINHVREPLTYPVLGTVPAGPGEINAYEHLTTEEVNFNPLDHAFLLIDEEYGYSMTPVIKPGDLVLFSFSAKINNGDKVVARWDKTKGAIKIVNFLHEEDPSMISLSSANIAVQPIFLKRSKVRMYKVVAWFDRQDIKRIKK